MSLILKFDLFFYLYDLTVEFVQNVFLVIASRCVGLQHNNLLAST